MESGKVRVPNIRDVARLAGVSYQTVSRAINESPSIRDSTRQRVFDVIDEIGYRPNQAARALVTSRSGTIGVLVAPTAHYGPTMSITAIEHAARDAGYRVSLTNLSSTDRASIKSGLDYLLSQSVEALVVIAPQARVVEVLQELPISVPFVTLQSSEMGGRAHSLSVDQVAGARMATEHLINLGHHDILHISGPQDWIEAEARMQGYHDALTAAGLSAPAPIFGDWSAEFGYRAGLDRLPARDFTAVFAGNDQMALGFTHACRDMELSIPGDFSIVGFDDVPEAAHFLPPLTTIKQNFTEIGRRAVSLLVGGLRGEESPHPGQLVPELVVRESTGRPRQ